MIDIGRAAVAAVEEAAFGGTTLDDVLGREVLEQFLEGVAAGPWWGRCGPAIAVSSPRAGSRSSSARECGNGVEIRFTDEQLTLATVAHELAHALVGVDRGHDPMFRAAHVDVTAVLAGTDVASALAESYSAFDLTVADRTWPAPFRAAGRGFVITTDGS
jgi:hypothetical protein